MTSNSNEKKAARERAKQLGVPYATALNDLRSAKKALSPVERQFWEEVFKNAHIRESVTPVERRPNKDSEGWTFRFETTESETVEIVERAILSVMKAADAEIQFQGVDDNAKAFELVHRGPLGDFGIADFEWAQWGWGTAFLELGLHDSAGRHPIVINEDQIELLTGHVRIVDFQGVPGATHKEVRTKAKELAEAANVNFLEVRASSVASGNFQLIMSEHSPLQEPPLFEGSEDQLIVGPSDRPNLRWGLGLDAKHETLWDDFANADVPHLSLFAGTKAGKTTVIQGMLLQLMSNNTPEQLELVLVEPQIGLEEWFDHVHVVDSVSMIKDHPEGGPASVRANSPVRFLGQLAHLLSETVDELRQRNQAFAEVGKEVQKRAVGNLVEAWEMALEIEDEYPEFAARLRVPARIIVIEEVAFGLQKPNRQISPAGAAWHEIVMGHLSTIAATGRSAGIFLVMVSQDARKECFPTLAKGNSRAIGMKVGNSMTSLHAIGMTGLEELVGYGHLIYDSSSLGWVLGRSFYPPIEVVQRIKGNLPQSDKSRVISPLLEIPELHAEREAEGGVST